MKKIVTLLFLLLTTLTFGANTAITSGDWNTNSTWSTGHVPNTTDSVFIPSGKSVTNSANASCGYIQIDGTLRNSGLLTCKGFFSVNGTFNPTTGTVLFNGSTTQKIVGTVSTIPFWNIINKNSSLLSLGTNIDIYGSLQMSNNSVLNTSLKTLTLKSVSSTQTGRIIALPTSYTFTGNITQERYVRGAGWHMIGTNITTPTITATKYKEPVAGNLNVGYTSGLLSPGEGGFIYTTGDTLISVTGPFTQGTQVYPLDLSGLDLANDGWNLVANPYPSEINVDSPSFRLTGTTNVVYVWDYTTQSYLWWKVGAGGTYQNTLASGQAFWVQAINNLATLKVSESTKTSSNPVFYREATTLVASTDPTIKINLNADNHNSTVFAVVGSYIDQYDPTTDGQYLESSITLKSELYTKSTDNYKLVYNCRDLKDTVAIPLYIRPHTLNPHVLTLDGLETLSSEYRWLIYNNRTGQTITENTITFTPTSLDEKNPYTLYIIKKSLPGANTLNGIDKPTGSVFEKVIRIFDQNGRIVDRKDNLSSGVYIFVYEEPNGTYTKKRLVIN